MRVGRPSYFDLNHSWLPRIKKAHAERIPTCGECIRGHNGEQPCAETARCIYLQGGKR